ncbi:hypothetical protein [Nocardia sputorum]|uniref:Uncharacterized protein n=1 Tax=Nocardia sputorum TaxID=2984338 RepID=A0ABN6U8Z8_9NOCA|nr:hypothetical protein [Nocardia sputorum]BDU01692.1 hypothetical protein IFM12276_47200 [Nocardia sputorum]
MNSGDFITRLKRYGDLEWYRHAGGTGDDGTPTPPLVVWRFPEPQPARLAELLHEAASAENREIDWLFDTTRRNWVLVPSRVMAEKERHGLATEAQAVDLLVRTDPDFCHRSVRDLERITAVLDRYSGS